MKYHRKKTDCIKYYTWEPWKFKSISCFEPWNVFGTIFGQWEFPKYITNCWFFRPAKTFVLLDRCCFWWSRALVHQTISKTVIVGLEKLLNRQLSCWWFEMPQQSFGIRVMCLFEKWLSLSSPRWIPCNIAPCRLWMTWIKTPII